MNLQAPTRPRGKRGIETLVDLRLREVLPSLPQLNE